MRIQRDDYAAAKRITDVLIEHQCPDKQIYDSAAIAAFVLNDYDQAEKYFKLAKDNRRPIDLRQGAGADAEGIQRFLGEGKSRFARRKRKPTTCRGCKLTTTKGDIVLELFENEAPETVGNFVSLVEKGNFTTASIFIASSRTSWPRAAIPKAMVRAGRATTFIASAIKPGLPQAFSREPEHGPRAAATQAARSSSLRSGKRRISTASTPALAA